MTVAEILSAIAVLLNVAVAIAGATWGIAKVNRQVKGALEKELESLHDIIHQVELREERQMGEMGLALRAKIQEVELHLRDNFIRRDVFQDTVKILSANMESQFSRLEGAINRLSDKVSALTQRSLGPP